MGVPAACALPGGGVDNDGVHEVLADEGHGGEHGGGGARLLRHVPPVDALRARVRDLVHQRRQREVRVEVARRRRHVLPTVALFWRLVRDPRELNALRFCLPPEQVSEGAPLIRVERLARRERRVDSLEIARPSLRRRRRSRGRRALSVVPEPLEHREDACPLLTHGGEVAAREGVGMLLHEHDEAVQDEEYRVRDGPVAECRHGDHAGNEQGLPDLHVGCQRFQEQMSVRTEGKERLPAHVLDDPPRAIPVDAALQHQALEHPADARETAHHDVAEKEEPHFKLELSARALS